MRKFSVFLVTILVFVGSFAEYHIALAVRGEGSATIAVDGGAPGGGVSVVQNDSHTFTVVLTVGASGISANAENPTFTIPAGFTAPDATPVANAGLVVADGDWSVIGGATCLVDSPSVGLTAALGQVITVDVTTACTVGPGGTITLTYKGTSATTMGATGVDIGVNDVISALPVKSISLAPNSATLPTITVTAAVAPTVAVTMDDTALNIGDTALITFTFSEAPVGFTTADVTVANGALSGFTVTGNPLVYTATFTPTSGITDATNVATVGTDWTDAALNVGVGGSSPNYTIDTTVPASGGGAQQPGHITIVKTVINDNGGTKVVADFPLFVNGSPVVSGATNVYPAPAVTYTVTETSNANYTQTFSGACDTSGHFTLSPGDNKVCIITNDDIGAPAVPPVPPLIDVVKVPSPLALPSGPGPVTYTYTLRNSGTVPVTDITMVGDTCSPIVRASGDTNANNKLEVNETWVYRCSTTLPATHTNVVTTTGWANGISAIDIASATVVVGASVVPPLIHVTKAPSPLTLPAGGGTVTYTEKITNPGTVALSNVSISDDKCSPVTYVSGDTNRDAKLAVNETWTYTCRTNLTRSTTNTVSVSGDANGLTARDFAAATVLVAAPGLPNTGLPPFVTDMPWWSIVLLAVLAAVAVFYVVRKTKMK